MRGGLHDHQSPSWKIKHVAVKTPSSFQPFELNLNTFQDLPSPKHPALNPPNHPQTRQKLIKTLRSAGGESSRSTKERSSPTRERPVSIMKDRPSSVHAEPRSPTFQGFQGLGFETSPGGRSNTKERSRAYTAK